jgi:hypothetical protein
MCLILVTDNRACAECQGDPSRQRQRPIEIEAAVEALAGVVVRRQQARGAVVVVCRTAERASADPACHVPPASGREVRYVVRRLRLPVAIVEAEESLRVSVCVNSTPLVVLRRFWKSWRGCCWWLRLTWERQIYNPETGPSNSRAVGRTLIGGEQSALRDLVGDANPAAVAYEDRVLEAGS